MSADRRGRPSAVAARIANQPYPATDQRKQTIQAWVASLEDAPQPQLGRLASNTITAPPDSAPQPPSPTPLPTKVQYSSIPLLAVANGRVEPGTDGTDYHVQGALALHSDSNALELQLPVLPPADYSNLSPDVRMKEPWERSTVASTMHTVSMLDWNADADAGSEFETMSDWTARPSRGAGEVLTLPAPPPPQELEGEKKANKGEVEEEGEEGSDYAPSSRSVTPPRRVLPRKARRNTTRTPRRTADLDEEYDNKDIDLDAAINEEPSEPKAKRRRYISSGTTAVEGHSARSSPRSSPSPPPPPPPSTRGKGVLRGKVARRASFRPSAHFGSRDANDSDSA